MDRNVAPRGVQADWPILLTGLVALPILVAFFAPITFSALLDGDRSQWLIFMLWIAVWEWAAFLGTVYWLRKTDRGLADVGWPAVKLGDVIAVASVLVVLGTLAILKPINAEFPIDEATFLLPRSVSEKLFFLLMALTAAVCEETIFRGAGMTLLKNRTGTWLAVLITTTAFVMMHGGIAQGIPAALARGTLGLIFVGLSSWRKNLRAAIYTHFAIDAALVLAV